MKNRISSGLLTLAIFLTVLLGVSFSLQAAVFNVTPGGGPCGGGSGGLQECLDEAATNGQGDTLNLASGTYTAGPYTYIPAAENFPLTIQNGEVTRPVLDGSGFAGIILEINTNPIPDDNADITIRGLVFQNTMTDSALDIFTDEAATIVENCDFLNNQSSTPGGGLEIFNEDGGIELRNSLFEGNNSDSRGGGASLGFYTSDVIVEFNSFIGNTSEFEGGGFQLSHDQNTSVAVTIFNNLVLNNTSTMGDGGGISFAVQLGSVLGSNNIVAGNTALENGGGIFGDLTDSAGGVFTLVQNTITGNTAQSENGGGLNLNFAGDAWTGNVYNNIIWNNQAFVGFDIFSDEDAGLSGDSAALNVFNNDFTDFFSVCRDDGTCPNNTQTGNNVNVDPLFIDAAADDYHLQVDEFGISPVINIGDATAPDVPPVDFDGEPRPFPAGTNPDLGALEAGEYIPVLEQVQGSGTVGCSLSSNGGAPLNMGAFLMGLAVLVLLRGMKKEV